ncbi:hypothetical protein [Trichormus variabilis]|uniref:Uncharacterized protein n=1 Tax=Trichormus variabilis SAG 1403-4b TaxID=447716 RepID=A0A3S1A5R3_ANAVA|nr:hypothetical protein [Trichormus variabilis]MBD2628814.1 hypothetical protein [Trichormus variabilis FACHB-164]RUS94143.1 hypothetical protein DSM107003_40300 [Trichormus variabilis SAG 1403-4b]
MNQFLNLLQRKIFPSIVVISLVTFTFFGFPALNYSNSLAQADTVKTPEGIYYKGTPDTGKIRNDKQVENAPKKLKETAENIKERLNLDEPVPDATKEFLEDVQTNVEKTVEPITGTRRGFYQENVPEKSK